MLALSLIKNKIFKYKNLDLPKKINQNKCRIKVKYSAICSSDIPRAFENKSYYCQLFSSKSIENKHLWIYHKIY